MRLSRSEWWLVYLATLLVLIGMIVVVVRRPVVRIGGAHAPMSVVQGVGEPRDAQDEAFGPRASRNRTITASPAPPSKHKSDLELLGEGAYPPDSDFIRLSTCECHTWRCNGRFKGGLQFWPGTWRSVGGKGNPAFASIKEQIKRGRMLWWTKRSGKYGKYLRWSPWPGCSRKLGLR